MKLNWGKAIILVFIIFISFIVYIVKGSMNAKIDLVTENYYKKELQYQETINKLVNADSLHDKINLQFTATELAITLPSSLNGNLCTGEVYFYRPSDKSLDKLFPVETSTAKIILPNTFLSKGKWKVIITLSSEGVAYQFNEILFL